MKWPLVNVWLGCTVENQAAANERIPLLLQTPAAVRFVSLEPLLEAIDLTRIDYGAPYPRHIDALAGYCDNGKDTKLDWVITGPETGPGHRPSKTDDFRSLRDQCVAAGIAFHLKALEIDGKIVKRPELDGYQWLQFPGENK